MDITDPMGNHWVAEQKPASTRDTRGHHPGGVSLCMGITHIEFSVPLNTTGPITEYYRSQPPPPPPPHVFQPRSLRTPIRASCLHDGLTVPHGW